MIILLWCKKKSTDPPLPTKTWSTTAPTFTFPSPTLSAFHNMLCKVTPSPSITVHGSDERRTANICWLCKFDWSDTGIYSFYKVVLIIAISVFAESAATGPFFCQSHPSLIPRQHENGAGLIPRPYSLQHVRLEWDQTGLATESIASFPGSPRTRIYVSQGEPGIFLHKHDVIKMGLKLKGNVLWVVQPTMF